MSTTEFMSELFKIALEKVKERGLDFLLLIGIAYFLFNQWEQTELKLSAEIKELRTGLTMCEDQRGKIAIDLAALKATFEAHQIIAPRRK